MTAPSSAILLPAAVLRHGGQQVCRIDRRNMPPLGAELALEDPMTAGGWRYYAVTACEFWWAATATHQKIPNMVPGDVTVEVRALPVPSPRWVQPEPGLTRCVLQLDGRDIGYALPENIPPIDTVSTLDHPLDRVRARLTGIRCWYGDFSILPTGVPVYQRLMTAVQLTRIAL